MILCSINVTLCNTSAKTERLNKNKNIVNTSLQINLPLGVHDKFLAQQCYI